MRISEDKEFLILQRQKGRPGSMAGVDMVLYRRQNRADHRIEKEMSRKRKHQQMSEVNLELEDDFGMDYEEDIGDSEPEVAETNVKKNTKQTASTCINRGRKHFITPRLLSALDSAKVSDGKAMHILMATAEALGHCTSDLVVNRSTLHRLREEHRRKETQRIQESFIDKLSDTQAMVVHWDGKVLPDLIGKIKVERIAVLVSYNGESKFLGAPKLISATGENIATAVFDTLSKWNILDRVEGMSFDTTSTNTGPTNGACAQLQRMLGRNLLTLPCRHHILEIYLRSVFDLHFKVTQAPEVSIFERFAKAWPNIDTSSFKSGLDCEDIKSHISDGICNDIKQFCHSQLQKTFVRADYEEFLRLVLTCTLDVKGDIFLENISFS
ncbi:uncharacterized protein LOC126764549 [Bactrocera neohumeralis]|uniref:uncharacterized protein LOC126764549 n=2 Tax=Bactrocera neohumeralis TaxID=98809 RepID=UPI0021668D2F|nr:uncharacterized protein LOC126764549 [Bactrocera neohumeralis]